MRPALDRLLSRPFSLYLLRYLTSTTLESHPTVTKHRRVCKIRITHGRHHATHAAVPISTDEDSGSSGESSITSGITQITKESGPQNVCDEAATPVPAENAHNQDVHIRPPFASVGQTPKEPIFFKRVLQGKDSTREWTFNEIHFEAALDQPKRKGRKRLVEQAEHRDDFKLWAQLLAHRRRIFGLEGIKVIWDKMREKKLQIPYEGHLGALFWNSFIDLGLRKRKVLDEIFRYAEENGQSLQRLPTLYVRIIQHFALQGSLSDVIFWHQRLISSCPPSAQRFKQMVRTLVYSRGDMDILSYIYQASEHRNAYANVVPVLCAQRRFQEALKWHHVLISHLDLPQDAKAVKLLQSHLVCYHPRKAIEFIQSLSDAGVSFMDPEPTRFMLSREMVNRVHGETHGIKEKPYSDKLGARWFATTWVSLDLAINSVHALGFREIGPLSLQSIAIREQDASKITERIAQLRVLGMSIGNSRYSQAIETFARRNQHYLLKSLLESDQHPDALEDWELQESLLGRYAFAGEWAAYARTIAIRSIGYPKSMAQEYNIIIRGHLTRPDWNFESISNLLEEMRVRNLQVKPTTIRLLIRKLLRPRRTAHHPVFLPKNPKDLEAVISILHNMLKSGSYVPGSLWLEIMKRLAMDRKLVQLEVLCLTLADWYHPQSTTRQQNVFHYCRHSSDLRKFAIPAEIESSHPKHPFSRLFPPILQLAIVEWGFIAYFRQFANPFLAKHQSDIPYSEVPNPSKYAIGKHPCTHGLRLLRLLCKQGVAIHLNVIRIAVINRLIAYYGLSSSARWHNRIARKLNPFAFDAFLEEIEAAWGGVGSKRERIFSEEEARGLEQRVHNLDKTRTVRLQRRYARITDKRMAKKKESKMKLRSFNDGEIIFFEAKAAG